MATQTGTSARASRPIQAISQRFSVTDTAPPGLPARGRCFFVRSQPRSFCEMLLIGGLIGGCYRIPGNAEQVQDRVQVGNVERRVGGVPDDWLGVEGDAEP